MGRLVYHDLSAISGQLSPFDEAVLEVAISGSVSIVSPYIGVDYLQRIIQVSTEWKLISDIEAWLSSLSIRARPKAWLFIRENLERIHHCPAIHAKAVIGQKLAMFGSANLTNTGILGRTELNILIDDPLMVIELGAWFDSLWQQTLPPIADETNAFVQWLDEEAVRAPARRDRFSLSASSKKIRSSLVKLPSPDAPKLDGEPLNLDAIAQTLVLQEQRHYETLEEAVEVAVNTLAKDKFAFYQVVAIIRKGFSSASIREIYFTLLQHCANHVRSVFAENTRNRLILLDGTFTQSDRELISQVLDPFDLFLANLIHHLDFTQSRDLLDEETIEKKTGFRGNDQVILISELLDYGVIELEDVAGHLPRYRLSEDFEWDGRYRLFSKATHDWIAKKNRPEQHTEEPELTDIGDDLGSDFSLGHLPDDTDIFDQSDNPIFQFHDSASDIRSANAELARVTQERHVKIDKVLANVLARLFAGNRLTPTKYFAEQPSKELGIGQKLVQLIISGSGKEMPKVIITAQNAISINPRLNWKELKGYPLTQEVCKSFLEM